MCIVGDIYTHEAVMRTNIDIDDKLMAAALKAAGTTVKKEAITQALELMVQRKKQMGMLKLIGKIDWEGDIDAWRRD